MRSSRPSKRPTAPPVLVVHSAAGFSGYAASDRVPDRIAAMVYVDTAPGKGAMDPDFTDAEKPLDWDAIEEEENLDGLSEEQKETFRQRAVPVPGAVLRDSVELTNDARSDIPSTLICTAFTAEQYQTYAKEHPEWAFLAGIPELRNATWVDLPTSHWPMWSRPTELATDHRRRREGLRRRPMTDSQPITAREFGEADGAEDWRVLSDGAYAFFRTDSFAASAGLVNAIAGLADLEAHQPDVDVRRDGVTVRLITITDDSYGMSHADLELARRISALARDLGLPADPSSVQSLLVIPGAPDAAAVMPFWRAVLGYEPRADSPDEDLVDPHDRGPAFWIEGMDEPRADGGGAIHVGIWVPIEQAEARVAAALAAGGRMVRDQFAPAWWTLADAAGNEADIATIETRD